MLCGLAMMAQAVVSDGLFLDNQPADAAQA
jgi:hypothetical protein